MSQQLTLENKPLIPKEIKPFRWITLGEQKAFVNFLKMLGNVGVMLLHYGKLEWCATEFERFKCSKDSTHARKTRYLPCGLRGICPRCSMVYAHKRANIQYQWLKMNLADKLPFDLKMNQIVLTLPQNLHGMDSTLFTKMVRAFMAKFEIEAYGYCVQNSHSKNPLGEKYLHCHVLSLSIKKGSSGIEKNHYYFDVDLMRQRWKEIISKFTNEQIDGQVNLFTEYASILKDKPKIIHMLEYLYRYPIQDLFHVQIRDRSINYLENSQIDPAHYNILQVNISSKLLQLVSQKKTRIVWCGLLTSTKRKELIKLLDVGESLWLSLRQVEKMLDERSKVCVDCGYLYETIPFDRGRYQGDNEPDTTTTDATTTKNDVSSSSSGEGVWGRERSPTIIEESCSVPVLKWIE